MFLGEFEYRLDEKGRMPFPPRFRPYFKEGVIVAPSPEKCLSVYTIAEWKKMADRLASGGLALVGALYLPGKWYVIIAGLLPVMYGQDIGTDVMKRIAAPLIGGMVTAPILSLIIIPVVYLWWQERLLSQPSNRT